MMLNLWTVEAPATRVSVSKRWLIGVAWFLFFFVAQLCPRHRACHRVGTSVSVRVNHWWPSSECLLVFLACLLSKLEFLKCDCLCRTWGTMHPLSSVTNYDKHLHPKIQYWDYWIYFLCHYSLPSPLLLTTPCFLNMNGFKFINIVGIDFYITWHIHIIHSIHKFWVKCFWYQINLKYL